MPQHRITFFGSWEAQLGRSRQIKVVVFKKYILDIFDQSNLRMAHRSKLDQIKKDLHKLETTHQRLKSIAIYCAEAIERRFQPQTPEGSNTKWCCRYLYFLKKHIYIIYYIIRSSAESFRFWTFLWGRGLYCLHKICHVQSLRWNHPCRGPWNQLIDRFNQRS